MGSHRVERVADQIRAALSEIIRRRMSDPRVELATIAAVRVSDDLKHALVFVGSLAGPERRDEAVERLTRASGFLRREIGSALRLKYLPALRFVPDTLEDDAARVDQALHDLGLDGGGD